MKSKYKKYDIIIKNHVDNGRSYVSPYDKNNVTKYTIRKVEKRSIGGTNYYVYGFRESYGFVYDGKIIDEEFDLYDITYIRRKKLEKIKENMDESSR